MHQKLLFWGHKMIFFLGRGHSPLSRFLPHPTTSAYRTPFWNPKYATDHTPPNLCYSRCKHAVRDPRSRTLLLIKQPAHSHFVHRVQWIWLVTSPSPCVCQQCGQMRQVDKNGIVYDARYCGELLRLFTRKYTKLFLWSESWPACRITC